MVENKFPNPKPYYTIEFGERLVTMTENKLDDFKFNEEINLYSRLYLFDVIEKVIIRDLKIKEYLFILDNI